MMKQLLCVLLAAVLLFSAAFCVSAAETDEIPAAADVEMIPTATEPPTEEPTEPPVEAMPVIVNAEPAKDGVKLSYTACDGAAKYRLFIKKADGTGWKGIGDTAALTFTRTGMADYSTDIYTVRALDNSGRFCSGYDKEGYSYTYLPAPVLKKAESVNGGVRVSWSAVNGAPGYRVYSKTTGSWKCLGETADTEFFDTAVTSGTAYTYTVKVRDNENGVLLSYHDTVGIKVAYVASPVLTSAAIAEGGIKVAWKKSDGAAKYRVFTKKADGTGWKGIGDTSSTSFVHKNLNNQEKNTYTIRALNGSGSYISGYDKEGLTATFYATPALGKVTNETGGQQFTWKAVPGAVNYKAYVKKSSGWEAIGFTTGTSFLYSKAKSGKSYTYTVRVCSADGKELLSWFEKPGVGGLFVSAPEITGFTPADGGTTVKWSKTDGAAKYRLFYKTDTAWKGIGDTTGASLTHKNPTAGKVYTYTVRALDNNGAFISGYDKTGRDYRYIAPPAIKQVKKTAEGMTLNWNAVAGAAGCRVYRKVFGASWTKIADSYVASYTDTTAPANVPYAYTLRTLDENGVLNSYYIKDTLWYCNGALADGKITANGTSLYFNKGRIRQGFVTIDGKTYYYNENGVLQKNGVVGSEAEGYRYADKNGVIDNTARLAVSWGGYDWNILDGKAYRVSTEKDRTLHRALKLVSKLTKTTDSKAQKLRKCFDYLQTETYECNPRVPHYRGMDWPIIYANDIFTTGGGNCLSYAAAFGFMAKAIGYEDVYGCHSGGHGWTEIGGLIYDTEWQRSHHTYSYYGLSYYASTDVNYLGVQVNFASNAWMHVKI